MNTTTTPTPTTYPITASVGRYIIKVDEIGPPAAPVYTVEVLESTGFVATWTRVETPHGDTQLLRSHKTAKTARAIAHDTTLLLLAGYTIESVVWLVWGVDAS
jgi:hypothetical protein